MLQRKMGTVIALLMICSLLFGVLSGCAARDDAPFCVEVLDVGQSDCTLITAGDAVMMIDTGTALARHAVQGYLADRKITHIDCLLITHPHEDHSGNARMLLEQYSVGRLLISPVVDEDAGYALVLKTAERLGVPCICVQAGDVFSLGDATAEVLLADAAAQDANDASVVLRTVYGDIAFLFMGDVTEAGEARLLAAVPASKLACTVLKAGHHGSGASTGTALLQAASPTYAAISCGVQNTYGFPDAAMLARLEGAGVQWQRTDTDGCIRYESDGSCVNVYTNVQQKVAYGTGKEESNEG